MDEYGREEDNEATRARRRRDELFRQQDCRISMKVDPTLIKSRMYANGAFDYDFTINTPTKAFKAHKFVLDQCSDLLRRHIETQIDLRESPETVAALLQHCYGHFLPCLAGDDCEAIEAENIPLFAALYRVATKA